MGEPEVKPVYLDDLFKTNFSLFNNLTRGEKINQIGKVNYIWTIAKNLEKDLSGIDLRKIFELTETNEFNLSESEINKILINTDISKLKVIEEINETELTTEIEETVKIIEETALNKEKQAITEKMRAEARNIRDYSHSLSLLRHKVRELALKELDLKNKDFGFMIKHIKSIVKTGKFDFTIEQGKLIFTFKDNIVITYKNSDCNYRVDLGRFKLVFNYYSGFNLRVEPCGDNVHYKDYVHPHVNDGGDLCLGNMNELWSDAFNDDNLYDLVDITSKILLNYNHSDPYIGIQTFVEQSNQMQPDGRILEVPIRYEMIDCQHCDYSFDIEVVDNWGEAHCPECDYYNEVEF